MAHERRQAAIVAADEYFNDPIYNMINTLSFSLLSLVLFLNCAGSLTDIIVSKEKLNKTVLTQEINNVKIDESNIFNFELPYSGWYSLKLFIGNDLYKYIKNSEEKDSLPFVFRVILCDKEKNNIIYLDKQYTFPNAWGCGFEELSTSKALSYGRPFIPKKHVITGKLIITKKEVEYNPINLTLSVGRVSSYLR